ncbi:MAG: hypothetical protein GQ569_08335 [Methylococcaceae bacterium]|nr:hypothetical protein [Methylococcaceae bacterium]
MNSYPDEEAFEWAKKMAYEKAYKESYQANALCIAKKLLQADLEIAFISQVTELSIEQVKQLAE